MKGLRKIVEVSTKCWRMIKQIISRGQTGLLITDNGGANFQTNHSG